MKLVPISLACLLFSFSYSSYAASLENGWTKDNYKKFVDSCVSTAVKKNIDYLIEKNAVSTDSEFYDKIVETVKKYQTSVCQCTQGKIMKDYRYSDVKKVMNKKSYIVKIAEKCSEKVSGQKVKKN